jgi:hypothetical protein
VRFSHAPPGQCGGWQTSQDTSGGKIHRASLKHLKRESAYRSAKIVRQSPLNMRDGFISEDRSNDGAQVSETQKVRRLVCDSAEKNFKLVTQKRLEVDGIFNSIILSELSRPKWAVDDGPATPAFATGLSNRILNRRKRLSLTKLADANVSCPSVGVVYSTKFDKTGRVRYKRLIKMRKTKMENTKVVVNRR